MFLSVCLPFLFSFSWDEGKTWSTHQLTTSPFFVENIITEPNATAGQTSERRKSREGRKERGHTLHFLWSSSWTCSIVLLLVVVVLLRNLHCVWVEGRSWCSCLCGLLAISSAAVSGIRCPRNSRKRLCSLVAQVWLPPSWPFLLSLAFLLLFFLFFCFAFRLFFICGTTVNKREDGVGEDRQCQGYDAPGTQESDYALWTLKYGNKASLSASLRVGNKEKNNELLGVLSPRFYSTFSSSLVTLFLPLLLSASPFSSLSDLMRQKGYLSFNSRTMMRCIDASLSPLLSFLFPHLSSSSTALSGSFPCLFYSLPFSFEAMKGLSVIQQQDNDEMRGCLMGHTLQYTRKKRLNRCFNPEQYEHKIVKQDCPCTDDDFEW